MVGTTSTTNRLDARSIKRRKGFDVSEVFTLFCCSKRLALCHRRGRCIHFTLSIQRESNGLLCTACAVSMDTTGTMVSSRRREKHQFAVEHGLPHENTVVEQGLPLPNSAVEQSFLRVTTVIEQRLPCKWSAVEQDLPHHASTVDSRVLPSSNSDTFSCPHSCLDRS